MMNRTLVLSALLLASPSSAKDGPQNALMDRVERLAQMPKGSFQIDKYARYYAFGAHRRVIGVYITDVDPKNRSYDLAVGKHRWVDVARNLPVIMDGGCSVVTVQFDLQTNRSKAWCNGVA